MTAEYLPDQKQSLCLFLKLGAESADHIPGHVIRQTLDGGMVKKDKQAAAAAKKQRTLQSRVLLVRTGTD